MDIFRLPGFTSNFYFHKPIIPGGHLTFAEFLHYDPKTGSYRALPTKQHVENALRLAHAFEEVREYLGNKPIIITSGYRDPITNKKVGGVNNSYHTKALALDFVHSELSPNQVQDKLKGWWWGGLGLAAKKGFTHIDLGPKREFNY